MRLLIIRHGQSSNNLLHATTGSYHGASPDPLLTELGDLQSARLAEAMLAGVQPRVDVLYSSLMVRALQTAAPIANALELDIIGHLEAYECGGPYSGPLTNRVFHPGSGRSLLQAIHPRIQLPDAVSENGWYVDTQEDEPSWADRGRRLVAELLDGYLGQDLTVGLVCHEWFSQYVFRAALSFEPVNGLAEPWFSLNNTGTIFIDLEQPTPVTEVEHNGGHTERVVEWHNYCGHLRPEEVTG